MDECSDVLDGFVAEGAFKRVAKVKRLESGGACAGEAVKGTDGTFDSVAFYGRWMPLWCRKLVWPRWIVVRRVLVAQLVVYRGGAAMSRYTSVA